MHLNAQPPIFVPDQFRAEIEKLSKAALMDMVWDYATRCAHDTDEAVIMSELRTTANIILGHRSAELGEHQRRQRELKASFDAITAGEQK